MSLKDIGKEHNIPYWWLHRRMGHQEMTLDEALHAFTHPTVDERIMADTVDKPLSKKTMMHQVEMAYSLSLTDLVQYWASLGYRIKRMAHWLNVSPSNLRGIICNMKFRITWPEAPDLDGMGRPVRYTVDGSPMTLTAFAARYDFQTGGLSERWHHLTTEQMSREMTKIALSRKVDPIRGFLTMKLI